MSFSPREVPKTGHSSLPSGFKVNLNAFLCPPGRHPDPHDPEDSPDYARYLSCSISKSLRHLVLGRGPESVASTCCAHTSVGRSRGSRCTSAQRPHARAGRPVIIRRRAAQAESRVSPTDRPLPPEGPPRLRGCCSPSAHRRAHRPSAEVVDARLAVGMEAPAQHGPRERVLQAVAMAVAVPRAMAQESADEEEAGVAVTATALATV